MTSIDRDLNKCRICGLEHLEVVNRATIAEWPWLLLYNNQPSTYNKLPFVITHLALSQYM